MWSSITWSWRIDVGHLQEGMCDNVILYRWVIFTVSSPYSCTVTLLLLSHIWTWICVSTETFLPIVFALKPPKCQPCGVGTEKVSIWKPWMSLRIVCQSVRCFDISLLKWSWQKSSGFILGAPWISMLRFMAIPGMAFWKNIFYRNKMFDSEWRQMKRRRITKCGWNHCESSRRDLKMLMFRLIRGDWRFVQSPIYSCSYVHMLHRSILYFWPFFFF